jgi:glycerol-3-phosphate dehydrogenase (NAD(P)+)
MRPKIAIIGDGAMGTLCAWILAQAGRETVLWCRQSQHAAELAQARINVRHLPTVRLPESVEVTGQDAAISQGELIFLAVPSQHLRWVLTRLARHIPASVPVISLAKGIENDTLLRPTEICANLLGPRLLGVISGPSIADEVARGLPATVVAASSDDGLSRRMQELMSCPFLRVYRNADVVGVELAGASKNIIAIAAGILDGLAMGVNAKASLVTRGLAEITRLGMALGAQAETFSGLAGLGDLVTTCFSLSSRNRSFGQRIGAGLSPEQAQAEISGVVEGLPTTRSVVALARRYKVEMPISETLYTVLFEGCNPREGISTLMSRQPKAEHHQRH